MLDDITRAVLSREEVTRYLQGGRGESGTEARERVFAYLDELRTTQRYPIYRALKHPLYPILRKIDRRAEHVDIVRRATDAGHVVYVSNHKSHIDYLVEPLVLEDHVLARQGTKRAQRPFSREIAEMVRYAVGYRSRAFVTFGEPIDIANCDPHSRRDVLELAHRTRDAIGRLVKVLPTSLVASAMRPSLAPRELERRVGGLIEVLRTSGANLEVTDPHEAADAGVRAFIARGIIVAEDGRLRVRERNVLRYYGRMLDHLLHAPGDRTH